MQGTFPYSLKLYVKKIFNMMENQDVRLYIIHQIKRLFITGQWYRATILRTFFSLYLFFLMTVTLFEDIFYFFRKGL